jgi:hypothetical protein
VLGALGISPSRLHQQGNETNLTATGKHSHEMNGDLAG